MNSIKIWVPFCIVTISGQNKEECAIVTFKDKIIDVGELNIITEKYPNGYVVFLKDSIILPGFIDCHTHFELTNLHAQQNFHNLFSLMNAAGEWHKKSSCNDITDSCKRGQYTSLKNGIICSLDWRTQTVKKNDYLYPDNVIIAFEIIEARQELAKKKLREKINIIKNSFSGTHGYYWAPHSLYMVSEKLWKQIARKKHPITTHIAESLDEIEWLSTRKGALYEHCTKKSSIATIEKTTFNPLEILCKYGGLKERTMFVHGTWLPKSDLNSIKDNNCFLCLCPSSNLQLTGCMIDFDEVLESDVKFLIGSDSIYASYDLLSEARLLLTSSDKYYDNNVAKKLLKSMTIEAAKALDIIEGYGSIDVGKKASFIVINLEKPVKRDSIELDIILHGKIDLVILDGEVMA